jgi:hypothetical protein
VAGTARPALKTSPNFKKRKWLAEGDAVCVIDPATGDRRVQHGMDFLHRSLRDQHSLNLVLITVDFGSARFASIRTLVKAVKGTCTDIAVDADFEPDPSRNSISLLPCPARPTPGCGGRGDPPRARPGRPAGSHRGGDRAAPE